MSVTEITNSPGGQQSWEWFVEKSANVVRFLAPVIEANRTRRDLPRDLQEALDFFLSIAISDGLKLLSSASGRELNGRELSECVRAIRKHGENAFDQILRDLAAPGQHRTSMPPSFGFELIVGMRALISEDEAIDLPLIDEWLCNFDWRHTTVQQLRELTCRARSGEITLNHYVLCARLVIDALEAADSEVASDNAAENLFIGAR